MLNIGIDIDKDKCVACIKDDQGATIRQCTFANNTLGIADFIHGMERKNETRAVMESTGNYWCGLYDELEQNGIDVSLANPLKTRLIAEAKIKFDKIDSSVLSDLLRANLIVKSYVPPRIFEK
jgi:transposase